MKSLLSCQHQGRVNEITRQGIIDSRGYNTLGALQEYGDCTPTNGMRP